MISSQYPKQWDKSTIRSIFKDLDTYFVQQKRQLQVVTLGGVSIVLQDYQERSTNDIDVAPVFDSKDFLSVCESLGIHAQIVTMSSTVDFNDIEKVLLFEGKALKVFSVKALDLIRLKLERFRKQDPEDIYAIIQKEKIIYETFRDLVKEGITNYVGRPEAYRLSAQIVVETLYPDRLKDFLNQW